MVNFILKIVIKKLTKFIKYPTITQESLGTMIGLMIALIINTAIIVVVVSNS